MLRKRHATALPIDLIACAIRTCGNDFAVSFPFKYMSSIGSESGNKKSELSDLPITAASTNGSHPKELAPVGRSEGKTPPLWECGQSKPRRKNLRAGSAIDLCAENEPSHIWVACLRLCVGMGIRLQAWPLRAVAMAPYGSLAMQRSIESLALLQRTL